MNQDTGLTLAELLSLDSLMAVAQQRGLSLDDRLDNTQELAEAMAAIHGGLELSAGDRETIVKIRELASNLEIAPTLGELIELRGEALRQQE